MKTSFFDTLSSWVLPGLIAGAVFLAIALIAGALSTTVWAMPDGIAQTIGVAAPGRYGFALAPVLVGIVVHLALSIVLGIIFTAFVRWRRLHGWVLVAAAFIFISIETPIALWGIMHNVLPATTFYYFLAAIPLWGSVLGHYMYALVLGLLLVLDPFATVWKRQQPDVQIAARNQDEEYPPVRTRAIMRFSVQRQEDMRPPECLAPLLKRGGARGGQPPAPPHTAR
jgi:hypothetical protein